MENRGEQYNHYENPTDTTVEVIYDDDPGYNHDTFGETQNDAQNEIESLSTTQSYAEGPDGSFYVYNAQTGELDLSQPLQPTAEQEEAFQTALTAGEAEVALLAPGGTETQEVWSIQTLTYSITPDNRRVITIAATTEIREKREEPEEMADASGTDRVGNPDTIIITIPDASDFSPTPQVSAIEVPTILHEITAGPDTIDDTTVLIVFSESEPAATPQPPQKIPEVSIDLAPVESQSTPEVALPVISLNYPDMPAASALDATEDTEPFVPVLTAEPLIETEPLQKERVITIEPTTLETTPQEPTLKETPDIEQQPAETRPELPQPPKDIAPCTLQPEQVIYLNELPPVVATVVAPPPIAIVKKPAVLPATQKIIPLPQKEHRVEPLATAPEQRRAEPVRLNLEQTTAPKPEVVVHATSHEDAPVLTIETPAATTQNHSKERPVVVVPAERLVSPRHHHEIPVAPSVWKRATSSQNLMPWLTGFTADNAALTDDDIVISFKPGSVTNKRRRTMRVGSLAA